MALPCNKDETYEAKLQRLLDAESKNETAADPVQLGEAGYSQRYFKAKFNLELDNPKHLPTLQKLYHAYAEGLQWMMYYYYRGCPSWDWFFPFHYSPFASSLTHMEVLKPRLFIQNTLTKV
jgi:5'-3' exoribonuclease 2